MFLHLARMHPGSDVSTSFQMQVVTNYKSAFTRMIVGAIKIRNFKGLLLISRLEHHQCLIPELETKIMLCDGHLVNTSLLK